MPSLESIEVRKTLSKDSLDHEISIDQERENWEKDALSQPLPLGIELENEVIAGVPCLWVRDEHSHREKVMVHVHGGGGYLGSPLTHRGYAAQVVKTTQIPVVLVDYRLAPEHPFPAGTIDVQKVYMALLQERYQPEQIVISGDSSGANIALSALLQLRDQGERLPGAACFLSGVFDLTLSGESMETRATLDPMLAKDAMERANKIYVPDEYLTTPYASPLFADLSQLPPLLIQVGDHEILLSDSIRLAEKVKQSGGEAQLKVWDDMWHVWTMFPTLPEAQAGIEELRDFLSPLEIPRTPEDITPEWLSAALQQNENMGQPHVESFSSESIGNPGIGQLIRYQLVYQSSGDNAPTTLIAKFSNSNPQLREIHHRMRLYEKEVYFYQEMASESPLQAPQCYYGDIDSKTGHSILLLEDLSDLHSQDREIGCSSTQAELVIQHMAKFHAHWWNHPLLRSSAQVSSLEFMGKFLHDTFRENGTIFLQKLKTLVSQPELPTPFVKLVERFYSHPDNLFSPLDQSPITLLHLDTHLGNLLFGTKEGDAPLVVFDWQSYGHGRGVSDVTYFTLSAIPTDLRRQSEQALVKRYHNELVEHGIQDYSFEQCWEDYKRSAFWNLLVLTAVTMGDTSRPEVPQYIKTMLARIIDFHADHALDDYL